MVRSVDRHTRWDGTAAIAARAALSAALLAAAPSGCGVKQPLQSVPGQEDPVAVRATLGTPDCLARASNEIRLQAILLLDDAARSNCSAADPCTSADDIAGFVTLANLAFAPARVRFIFNPALDFAEVVDPDLNDNLTSNDSGGNWSAANAIAAGFPGKVVVLLRKVALSNFAYPPDTGQAVPTDAPFPITFAGVQPSFVAHDGRQVVARANAQSFSHELGHFLGLYHTHLGWGNLYPAAPPADGCPKADGSACTPGELDQAIINLQNARGPGALDGDLLADTPEDPGLFFWSANGLDPALVGTVIVGGVTYSPDRQNLMSSFGGFNLSARQIAAVRSSICDPRRRPLVSAPQARCRDVTLTAPAGTCTATGLTPAQVDNASFDPDGDAITLALDRTGPFPVGTTPVTLLVSDGTFSTPCTASVTVVEQTRPTITPPPKVTVTICTNDPVNVGVASAADNCGPPVVTGEVIVSNGLALTTPIPVVNGRAQIGPGTHVIRWIASDGSNLAIATQTVVVQATIQASDSFLVDDRAAVLDAATGAGAGLFNSGPGQTRVGFDARSGGILSVGPVQISDRATVSGPVISAGALDISRVASIAGAGAALAQVALPPMPALPAFPAVTGGNVTVNSGNRRALAAGSFGTVTVSSGGTLILGAGAFFFQNLTMNSGAAARVTPTTRIFVRNSFTAHSSFLASAGTAVQPIFFGFAGNTLGFDAVFNGTLVAPNASVVFGTGTGLTFTGAFYARSLEVRPQGVLACRVGAATL
ncbi:MAG TPA: hypothetical protein VFH68_13510 [Polyangia bacterium]|jgi:hypothetical protein|nr:hypothetical protein [Polyangia bacterium]